MLIAGFQITVNGKCPNEIAAATLHIQSTSGLNGNIPAICLIHNVFYRDRQVICRIVFRIHIIIDSDKTDTVGRKYPAHVAACFDVFTPQAGQILNNNTVGLALFNHVHHFLKCRAVKQDAAITVINLFSHDLNFRVPGNVVVDQTPLVGNAIAFHRFIIGIG